MHGPSEQGTSSDASLPIVCPSVDDMARFLDKTAPPGLTARVLAHLDACEACRVLLAATMSDTRGGNDEASAMSFVSPRTFPADEVVGRRYRIVRLISRGGMGEVYEAWDMQLGESVALKTIACTGLDNASLYVRIRKEVQLARKVTHQNVCRILEFGLHQQSFRDTVEVIPFFTMELLCGETLAAYLTRRGRVSIHEFSPIVAQIIHGLMAIHAAGIVHRDLKPENIFLLNGAEGQLRVVVVDFGLARVEDGHASLPGSSGESTVGTPSYMAPEQSLGGAPTVAWDIFALGVVLFRAVAGELPFKGNTAVALAMARIRERAPKLSSIVPDVDPWFEQIVARCLERDPESRYANAAELARALALGQSAGARRRKHNRLVVAGLAMAVGALSVVLAKAWRDRPNNTGARLLASSVAPLALLNETPLGTARLEVPSATAVALQPVEPSPPQAVTPVRHQPPVGAAVPATLRAKVRNKSPVPLTGALARPVSNVEGHLGSMDVAPMPGEDEIVVPDFARKRVLKVGEP